MEGEDSLLFANDINKKRAFLLAYHVLKLNAKCAVLTSNDCTKYPKVQEFDKVLCDVPCSGDGTIRKQKSNHIHKIIYSRVTYVSKYLQSFFRDGAVN